ncbi:MAG: 4a-hydroxytetrahydrobiopterin dehydratase [Cyanobacteria bacterium]|nr:4a-hydroxytetrahydrobiopterin dehydratase [Cyanobacteriota bacterium]
MALLGQGEIERRLGSLPGWQQRDRAIVCERVFADFVTAIAFVNRLVEPAEAANHHPDLSISYNRVTVTLTTHDEGGLTEKDFDLAQAIATLMAP